MMARLAKNPDLPYRIDSHCGFKGDFDQGLLMQAGVSKDVTHKKT